MLLVHSRNTWRSQKNKQLLTFSFTQTLINCPLVWHFSSCESIRKIEKIKNRYLRIILNDYKSDYENLNPNSNKSTMVIRRSSTLAVEIFKTLNEINSPLHEKYIHT